MVQWTFIFVDTVYIIIIIIMNNLKSLLLLNVFFIKSLYIISK